MKKSRWLQLRVLCDANDPTAELTFPLVPLARPSCYNNYVYGRSTLINFTRLVLSCHYRVVFSFNDTHSKVCYRVACGYYPVGNLDLRTNIGFTDDACFSRHDRTWCICRPRFESLRFSFFFSCVRVQQKIE